MDKYLILLVLSSVVSYKVDGRPSWNNGRSFGVRGVIFDASDLSAKFSVQNSGSRQFGHKQLQNWDPDRIWFPDFDEKTFSTETTSTEPAEVGTPVFSRNINECIYQCPKTSEYNPVCGTDRVTYSNIGKLECARSCGVDVALLRKLPCSLVFQESSTTQVTETLKDEQRRCIKSCPTTPEYNPICGTNFVTYQNRGALECAKFCGVVVDVKRLSPCPRPITTSTVSPDGQNLVNSDNQWSTSSSNSLTTVATDKLKELVPQEILNEIFNSPAGDSTEYDIDIRLRE